MSTKLLERKPEEVKIEIKTSAKEFEEYLEKAYQKNKGKYSVQGFRKGKVPRGIIEKNYGVEVFFEDAVNEGLSQNYSEFLKKNEDIVPFTWPEVDVKHVCADHGLEAVLSIPLSPTVKLGEYKGLKLKVDVNTVTDEEITTALNREQEKMARMEESKKASRNGDIVNLDFQGFCNDVAFEGGEAKEFDLTLGSGQFIPGFEDQLIGLKAGAEKDVVVVFPENYAAKDLAGKEATFKCKINAVKEKILPKLDDDFAKDVSEFTNFDDYKASIKKELELQKEKQAGIQLENKIIDKIMANSEFAIANAVIEEELNYMMRDLEQNLSVQGLNLQTYLEYIKQDEKTFRNARKSEAEKMVKTRLIFTEIIKKEGLSINENDCFDALKRQNGSLTDDSAKSYFDKLSEERKNVIRNDAMIDKLLNLLKNSNV